MLDNLIIFGLVASVLYLIFTAKNKETYSVSRYDDEVIEIIGGKFTLVDKGAK